MTEQKIDLYYATDPLCSFCWTFEPVLRKFRYQYGKYLSHDMVVMGGMIESWSDFEGDAEIGISQAEDVARHWRETGEVTRMVIDGSIWLEKPVASSFPGSKVYTVVRRDYPARTGLFLRRLREAVMLENKDIADRQVLKGLLSELAFPAEEILRAAESYEGSILLSQDIALTQALQVSGFPTTVLVDQQAQGLKIIGAQPFEVLEAAIRQMLGEEEEHLPDPVPSLEIVLAEYPLLSREIEILYDLLQDEVPHFMDMMLGRDGYTVRKILGENYYSMATG